MLPQLLYGILIAGYCTLPYTPPPVPVVHPKVIVAGIASWYDYRLDGIIWSKNHATCASRTFKRYSTVTVKNLANGKTVDCRINDFGPTLETGREIDLSSYAFSQLAPLSRGLINVEVYDKDE